MNILCRAWPIVLCVLLAACGGRDAAPAAQNPLDQAASEATAIVQSARATAMLLQAHAQATALIGGAAASPAPPAVATALPAAPTGLTVATPLPAGATDAPLAATPTVTGTIEVQVLGVALGAEGGFILVNFMAPPAVATRWYQGAVWVEDEATGARYTEVGVMPVVGPLFGRPVEPGQPGYVMLVNAPTPLKAGAVVTVVLGDYKFEHQTVQG
jgi:hypothetical protein